MIQQALAYGKQATPVSSIILIETIIVHSREGYINNLRTKENYTLQGIRKYYYD